MSTRLKWMTLAGLVAVSIVAALAQMPVLFAEMFIFFGQWDIAVTPAPADPSAFDPAPGPALGTVIDGYWRVQQIAPGTFAIGEPQNDPDNYEYLLIGQQRALLMDAGQTRSHDIQTVLKTLTRLPVTVIPSHLHWDHTNGLKYFSSIALIDLPETRANVRDGLVHLTRHEFIRNQPPTFRVTQWVQPNETIDLGERSVQVLSTPGHTKTSVSIYDPSIRALFTGDYIYPTTLFAFMPDSSLSDYVATADRLLSKLPPDTRLYGAHCCRNDLPAQAPWLSLSDLRDARSAMLAVQAGKAQGGRGFVIRRYPVNRRMTLLTLYPFGNQ